MPQSERPNEIEARVFLSEQLGVEMRHADTNGGVDYLFDAPEGRTGAVEVTTVTSAQAKAGNAAWLRMRQEQQPTRAVQQCWRVVLDEERAVYQGVIDRLIPHLAALENAGVHSFDENQLPVWLTGGSHDVRAAATGLRAHAVVQAAVVERSAPHDEHHVFVSRMGGWTAKGSDDSLRLLEQELSGRPDNARKLAAANVDQEHLFVWVDDDTPGEIARPFRGGHVSDWDHFGLPSRDPELPDHISDLWIVDRRSSAGWRWSRGQGWSAVSAPSPEPDEGGGGAEDEQTEEA